jgi:hypothetical protein
MDLNVIFSQLNYETFFRNLATSHLVTFQETSFELLKRSKLKMLTFT